MNSISEKVLAASGWSVADEGGPENDTPFARFKERLGFSLQNQALINPPAGSVGFDFRARTSDSVPGPGTEFGLRRALYKAFIEIAPHESCSAIDVNHGQWTFVPDQLRLTNLFEPFPAAVTPWADYVVYATTDFSGGVFCNPRNQHLVVLGSEFAARFVKLFQERQTSIENACRSDGN